MSEGPLRDLVVLELAGLGAVPFAGMLLADLGATVIQIQRPDDAGQRGLLDIDALTPDIDVLQRGRRFLELDLKSPDDCRLLKQMCSRADVFLEGFRPGSMERLGLDPTSLQLINPRLVYARLTGYGQTGPMSRTAGHDINYIADAGLLHALSRPGLGPIPPMNLLADYAGGGMLAALAIVSAVFEMLHSGEGQTIDLSMTDGAALLAARLMGLQKLPTWSSTPGTNFIDGGAPYYSTYETLDGQHVAVGALESRFYDQLLAGLGVDASDWPDRRDRSAWPELRERIAACFRTRTRDEWTARFAGSDACVSPVLTLDEAAVTPHALAHVQGAAPAARLEPQPHPWFSRTPAGRPHPPVEVTKSDITMWIDSVSHSRGGEATPDLDEVSPLPGGSA